jgi:hypothetical protein
LLLEGVMCAAVKPVDIVDEISISDVVFWIGKSCGGVA